MKAVLDANVFVSALISLRGAPRQIIDRWRAEAFELLTSEAILQEIGHVLRYPKIAALHRLSEPQLMEFLALLREESHIVNANDGRGTGRGHGQRQEVRQVSCVEG